MISTNSNISCHLYSVLSINDGPGQEILQFLSDKDPSSILTLATTCRAIFETVLLILPKIRSLRGLTSDTPSIDAPSLFTPIHNYLQFLHDIHSNDCEWEKIPKSLFQAVEKVHQWMKKEPSFIPPIMQSDLQHNIPKPFFEGRLKTILQLDDKAYNYYLARYQQEPLIKFDAKEGVRDLFSYLIECDMSDESLQKELSDVFGMNIALLLTSKAAMDHPEIFDAYEKALFTLTRSHRFSNVFQKAARFLKNDLFFMARAVQHNAYLFSEASDRLKSHKKLALQTLQQDGNMYALISQDLMNDEECKMIADEQRFIFDVYARPNVRRTAPISQRHDIMYSKNKRHPNI